MDEDITDLAGSDGVSIHTGFPNPALERRGQGQRLSLDLNQLLVQRPSSTYLFRIEGHHWADQGVYDGDVAVIDRALQAHANDLIISWRDGSSIIGKQHQLTADDQPWGRCNGYHPPIPCQVAMKPQFALIDCNNFFVSCERLFRPDLEGRPVVVLSSNDGCVVSRSNEAKALGIQMAAPAFKSRELFKTQGVVQFSANFELYGDISERITRILTHITPRTEVYSVDEAFLDLSHLEIDDYQAWGSTVRRRIQNEVGMPVSIGIAPSKTLAKLASEHAKKNQVLSGVLDLLVCDDDTRMAYLLQTPVKDIWGIGRKLAPKLRAEGIYNALDLAQARTQHASQLMGVHGRQLVAELNGTACHQLELFGRVRQMVMHGRMFGQDTNQFSVIESAIASLTAKAAYGLRRDGLCARTAQLTLSTNRHKPGFQRQEHLINFPTPTADTGHITQQLVEAAAAAWNDGRTWFHRANVLLYDLTSADRLQTDIFGEVDPIRSQAARNRLKAVDAINDAYGRRTIRYAAEDLSDAWQPKHGLRSPRYTTNWSELPIARLAPP